MYWLGESSIIQGEIFKYLDHNVHHYSYPMSHFVSQYKQRDAATYSEFSTRVSAH